MRLAALPTGSLEEAEKLEQLRALGTWDSNPRMGNHTCFIAHRQPGRCA